MTPFPLRVPPSIKLRVAACHVDFDLAGLGADGSTLLAKLAWIDSVLRTTTIQPHLIVFPEGADCGALRVWAKRWATSGYSTVCGTSQSGSRIQGVVVRPDGTEVQFYKKDLSPFDAVGAAGPVYRGDYPGAELIVPCQDMNGKTTTVNVRLLVCYDYRIHHMEAADFNHTQLIVVPMHDHKSAEPEEHAERLAHRHLQRTVLVNKAALAADGRRLRSSAFGPLAKPFVAHLEASQVAGVDIQKSRIWQKNCEGMTIGEYEVGQSCAPGHDTAYGAGFFYRVEHHDYKASTASDDAP